jgi:hypothetical protein
VLTLQTLQCPRQNCLLRHLQWPANVCVCVCVCVCVYCRREGVGWKGQAGRRGEVLTCCTGYGGGSGLGFMGLGRRV